MYTLYHRVNCRAPGVWSHRGRGRIRRTEVPMRPLLAAMVVLLTCSVAGTQEQVPSIKIGPVVVHLGMTKTEIESKGYGSGILKPNEDSWMITTGGTKAQVYGTVQFTASRVTYAGRGWLTSDSDAVEAILGATNSLNQEGLRTCV